MSTEDDRLLGHAEDNDGIEEYDNPLPDWWLGLFFFTVVFAVGYTIEYHALSKRSQAGAYDSEMLAAAERWPQRSGPSTLSYDDATLAAGKDVYAQTCAACHGAELQGGIGPNLADAEWIHGGTEADVIRTIAEGVPAKGMPAWGGPLGPDKVAKVAAFVLHRAGGPVEAAEGAVAAPDVVAVAPAEPVRSDADMAPAPADPQAGIEAGRAVYTQNCVACHGADLTGGIGPNLVDAEWIHGGELAQIEAVITEGVPAKGMIGWGPILGAEKIKQVAAFVHAQAHAD